MITQRYATVIIHFTFKLKIAVALLVYYIMGTGKSRCPSSQNMLLMLDMKGSRPGNQQVTTVRRLATNLNTSISWYGKPEEAMH